MKKTILILTILIIGLFLFGCIDSSPEAQLAREDITKTKMNIESGENLNSFLNCAEEFINLSNNNAEDSILQNKSVECESKSVALYADLNSLKNLIGSYKGKISEQFDKELESHFSNYIDLALSISMVKATIEVAVESIDVQEKIIKCESEITSTACSSCCETEFVNESGFQSEWFACSEKCTNKPKTTESEYCQNIPYPPSCENWPEETCLSTEQYEYDAEIKNDLSYCCGIAEPSEYVECYANALVSNSRNYSDCENVREKVFDGTNEGYVVNLSTRDLCYYLYASEEAFLEESLASTGEICENIEDEELRYMGICYMLVYS